MDVEGTCSSTFSYGYFRMLTDDQGSRSDHKSSSSQVIGSIQCSHLSLFNTTTPVILSATTMLPLSKCKRSRLVDSASTFFSVIHLTAPSDTDTSPKSELHEALTTLQGSANGNNSMTSRLDTLVDIPAIVSVTALSSYSKYTSF
jgi:hypothetical protein